MDSLHVGCGAVFKEALGFFDKWHELPRQELPGRKSQFGIWDAAGEWSWHSFEASCPVEDLLSRIIIGNWSTWPRRASLNVLLAGDSLDRNIVEFLCAVPESRRQGFRLRTLVHNLSQARECSNDRVRLINYKLFGLVEPSQIEVAKVQELREPHSQTLDALWRLSNLGQDVPDIHNFDAIIINSCLWDLSRPVTPSDPLAARFGLRYARRVREISSVMRDEYPAAMLYWRTCPSTSAPQVAAIADAPTRPHNCSKP